MSHLLSLHPGFRQSSRVWALRIPRRTPLKSTSETGSEIAHSSGERKENFMNWDEIAGKWKQFKGSAKQRWGKLTDDDLDYVAGTRDKLIGRLQEKYGMIKDDAERQADEWVKTHKNPAA